MLTGLPPFYHDDKNKMHRDIVETDIKNFKKFLHGEAWDLICKLLHKVPSKRLGAKTGIKEIKDHKYFADISWKDVLRRQYKYEKQYLKVDLTMTNFEYDEDDKFDIGLNIEEETMKTRTSAVIPNASQRGSRNV
jgi:serine/threonine protein kinase